MFFGIWWTFNLKNQYTTELLDELQKEVKTKLGILIKFKQTQMNEVFNEQQLEESTKDNIESLKDYVNINTCVDGSFQDISKLIVSEVKELFVFSNNTFYGFDEEFKIWK